MSAAVEPPLELSAPLLVHLQLRPRWACVGRAMGALDTLIGAHPAVAVAVCGLSRDPKYLRVTVSVALGPTETIARFSAEATAAFAFVSDVFTRLFDHAPCYVGEPTAAERAAAAAFGAPARARVHPVPAAVPA